MLLLFIVRNLKAGGWGGLEWHNVYIEFDESPLLSSTIIIGDRQKYTNNVRNK
jgi:hypothetical protein